MAIPLSVFPTGAKKSGDVAAPVFGAVAGVLPGAYVRVGRGNTPVSQEGYVDGDGRGGGVETWLFEQWVVLMDVDKDCGGNVRNGDVEDGYRTCWFFRWEIEESRFSA